jgi:hypothetical protein
MMAFYLLLLLLPAAWLAFPRSRAAAAAVTVTLALFIGLRDRVGGDWHAYWLIYERAKRLGVVAAMLLNDPAYMALNIAAGRLGLGIAFVNLGCAILFAAGLTLYARRQPLPWLALFVAIPVLVMVASMNSTRQATSVGLEMLALALYLGGKPRASVVALLFAFAFHWSAAVLLPLAALMLAPADRLRLAAWSVAALGAALVAAVWLGSEQRIFYHPSFGTVFRLIPSAATLVGLYLLRDRLDPRERTIAYYLAGLAIVCLAIWPASSMVTDRMGYYVIPLQMLVFPRIVEAAPTRRLRLAALAACLAWYLLMIVGWGLFSSYARCMVPYRSYLQHPAAMFGSSPPQRVC